MIQNCLSFHSAVILTCPITPTSTTPICFGTQARVPHRFVDRPLAVLFKHALLWKASLVSPPLAVKNGVFVEKLLFALPLFMEKKGFLLLQHFDLSIFPQFSAQKKLVLAKDKGGTKKQAAQIGPDKADWDFGIC